MEKITIGKITSAVALRGEVKVYPYTDYPERFEELETVFVDGIEREVKGVRYQGNMVILHLGGIDDRNKAEALRNKEVCIAEKDLKDLPEGTYYIRDLIGMRVRTEEGEEIGVLRDVLQNTAQDLYEVERANGKMLYIPGVDPFIQNVDKTAREITVRLPDGFLDL